MTPLAAELVEHYRYLLAVHANEPATGLCPLCQQASCPGWRAAFEQLTGAGALSDFKPLHDAPGVYVRSDP